MIQRVGSSAKPRKWMSVHEMGDMLGLKKTDRYWLVHKNYFRTETLLGKMRVEIASFEKWYANQDWYHSQSRYRTQEDRKKDAAAEAASLSMPEMAWLLDVPRSTVYGILSSKKYAPLLDVIVIAGRRRVTKESFERFLQAQDTMSCLILNMKNWSWKKNGNMRIISEDALQKQITARRKNVWSI